MSEPYFSDRELGPRPRINEEITKEAWGGIVACIESHIADGSFGYSYPLKCEDSKGVFGCNENLFYLALKAEISEIPRFLDPNILPPTLAILDLLEFCHRVIAKPVKIGHHPYLGHDHLTFKPEEGRALFREDINRIFARNGVVYEISSEGLVFRLAPEGLREILKLTLFKTGDKDLDSLLETARAKYVDPDLVIRKESLEKLWDAWERLKTIEPGKDKKQSTKSLFDKAGAELNFREALEKEANELTRIGNTFRIRHSETTKVALDQSEHIDYLFHRLFALIRLLLKSSGRGG
jgi:hypothetical protein